MILDPQNMRLDTLIYWAMCIIGWDIAKYTFYSNGVTNLHKNGMWDILSTF